MLGHRAYRLIVVSWRRNTCQNGDKAKLSNKNTISPRLAKGWREEGILSSLQALVSDREARREGWHGGTALARAAHTSVRAVQWHPIPYAPLECVRLERTGEGEGGTHRMGGGSCGQWPCSDPAHATQRHM